MFDSTKWFPCSLSPCIYAYDFAFSPSPLPCTLSQSDSSRDTRKVSSQTIMKASWATQRGTIAHTTDDGPNYDNTGFVGSASDGGRAAWLIASSFLAVFCYMGFSNSFGPLADYFLTHQLGGESADKVAWFGSLFAFLQFLSGLVGGSLFDRYGTKVWKCSCHLVIRNMMNSYG